MLDYTPLFKNFFEQIEHEKLFNDEYQFKLMKAKDNSSTCSFNLHELKQNFVNLLQQVSDIDKVALITTP